MSFHHTLIAGCLTLLLWGAVARAQDQTSAEQQAATPEVASHDRGFWADLVSPRALLATAPGTALDQLHDFPKEWGEGHAAAEKRAASLYGQFVIGDLIERGVKAIHPENTRYLRRGSGNFFLRMEHAIVFTVVARRPAGGYTPAYSTLANDYGSWAIATLWSPSSLRNATSIFEWGSGNVGVRAGGNALREFWPDVKSAFQKHKQ